MRFGSAFWINRTDWPDLRDACLAAERAGWDSLGSTTTCLPTRPTQPTPSSKAGRRFRRWLCLHASPTRPARRCQHLPQPGSDREARRDRRPPVGEAGSSSASAAAGSSASTTPSASTLVALRRTPRPAYEAAGLIRRLLDGERVTHEGRFYAMRDALCTPLPVQPRLPILIGGSGRPRPSARPPAMPTCGTDSGRPRRAATSEVPRQRCAEIGRPYDEIERTVTVDVLVRR